MKKVTVTDTPKPRVEVIDNPKRRVDPADVANAVWRKPLSMVGFKSSPPDIHCHHCGAVIEGMCWLVAIGQHGRPVIPARFLRPGSVAEPIVAEWMICTECSNEV